MNSAKKIIKNNGMGSGEERRKGKNTSLFDNKNKILVIVGILAILAGIFVVCYTQLRPRIVLTRRKGSAITGFGIRREAVCWETHCCP